MLSTIFSSSFQTIRGRPKPPGQCVLLQRPQIRHPRSSAFHCLFFGPFFFVYPSTFIFVTNLTSSLRFLSPRNTPISASIRSHFVRYLCYPFVSGPIFSRLSKHFRLRYARYPFGFPTLHSTNSITKSVSLHHYRTSFFRYHWNPFSHTFQPFRKTPYVFSHFIQPHLILRFMSNPLFIILFFHKGS